MKYFNKKEIAKMEKYMEVDIDISGVHDLSKEKMVADELQKMTSEESVSNQIGKVKEEKENR